jgi:hypothetical protein
MRLSNSSPETSPIVSESILVVQTGLIGIAGRPGGSEYGD